MPPVNADFGTGDEGGTLDTRNRCGLRPPGFREPGPIGVSGRKAGALGLGDIALQPVIVVRADTELIWILYGAYCTPAWRVSASTAPFDAQ